jgi:hypothetical protein
VEGQLDHRDRERDRRRRARDQGDARVADHTPRFLAAVARVCPPSDPPPPIPGPVAIDGPGPDERPTPDADVLSQMATTTTTPTLVTWDTAICRFCSRRGVTVESWARRTGSRLRDDRARRRRDAYPDP